MASSGEGTEGEGATSQEAEVTGSEGPSAPPNMVFCTNCGQAMDRNAWVCTSCGVQPMVSKNYCWSCDTPLNENQVLCVNCGASLVRPTTTNDGSDKKVLAGIMGIFFGALGVHKFILGYKTEGLVMLLVTVLTLGLGGIVMGIIGLIEGIIYLTKSDADFVAIYIKGRKGWF